jgi:hypothetical protein
VNALSIWAEHGFFDSLDRETSTELQRDGKRVSPDMDAVARGVGVWVGGGFLGAALVPAQGPFIRFAGRLALELHDWRHEWKKLVLRLRASVTGAVSRGVRAMHLCGNNGYVRLGQTWQVCIKGS